jgi:hypothetical protein
VEKKFDCRAIKMAEFSQATKNLINKYKLWQNSLKPKEGVSTIHVDEVASKVAAFYEQIRTVVDWQEEHLMRRSAIIRKLKGKFLNIEINENTQIPQDNEMAEGLVMELIRGGHFANDFIEEAKIAEVQKIINKYIVILKNIPKNQKDKAGIQFFNWLIEISACEVEETIEPDIKKNALIEHMFEIMKERIKVSDKILTLGYLNQEDRNTQIYIAIQQALFKFDKPMVSYNLIKYKYPQWINASPELILKISQNIYKIYRKINEDIAHRLAKKFYYICEKYDTPFLLIGDILSSDKVENIEKEISIPEKLEGLIRSAYRKRTKTLKSKLRRAAIYSTTSIFITKILSLLVLEVLLAKVQGNLNYYRLGADVLIPTFLMFILVATIRPPSSKNLNVVIMEAMKIVFQKEKSDTYEIRLPRQRGIIGKSVVSLFYFIGACISYGLIYLGFSSFGFPIASIIINIIFIALILFAGTAIRKRARELAVEDENEGFFSFIGDILLLPIMGLGRWLSNKWKKYNAFAAFFNALIDMPFSVFVEFIERWRYFIKEKKEDIR